MNEDEGLGCDCSPYGICPPAPPALAARFLRFFHRSRLRRYSAQLEELHETLLGLNRDVAKARRALSAFADKLEEEEDP